MFFKASKSKIAGHEAKVSMIVFGPNEKDGTILEVLHRFKVNSGKNLHYRIFEPQILGDLHHSSVEHKLFLQGYPVKKRMFKSLDMALDTLKRYYTKLFYILASDPDINRHLLEDKEYEYLKKHLPDNNQSKIILIKIKRVHGKEKEEEK